MRFNLHRSSREEVRRLVVGVIDVLALLWNVSVQFCNLVLKDDNNLRFVQFLGYSVLLSEL